MFTSNYTQLHWGWAVWEASLYLFVNLVFVVPVTYTPVVPCTTLLACPVNTTYFLPPTSYLRLSIYCYQQVNLLHVPALFSDRGGMLAFMGLGVTSQALFFGLSAEQETLQVGAYCPEDGGRWWETVGDGG